MLCAINARQCLCLAEGFASCFVPGHIVYSSRAKVLMTMVYSNDMKLLHSNFVSWGFYVVVASC